MSDGETDVPKTSPRDADQYIDWDVPKEPPLSPPPPATMAWVEAQLGSVISGVEPLVGGMSSSVHRLTLAGDRSRRVVLRRYTLGAWIEREPHIPHDEAKVLAMLGRLDLGTQTPTLLAADPDAASCDVPAVVMTEVPGQPLIAPANPLNFAERLADCLVGIHAVAVPSDLPTYRRWDRKESPVPDWVTDPDRWLRAKDRIAGPLPGHPDSFLHRDFHPNNVHWENDEICAVVDWLGACVGPIAADVSHCRWNLAILFDPQTAEHFTAHYRKQTGYSEETIEYDLSTILSGPVGPFPTSAWNALGRLDLTSSLVAVRNEAWLANVLDGPDAGS